MALYIISVPIYILLVISLCSKTGYGNFKQFHGDIQAESGFQDRYRRSNEFDGLPSQMEDDINQLPYIYETKSLPMANATQIDFRYMPFVGNGHLATTVLSDWIFVNGVYNGRLGLSNHASHRARIPSTNAIDVAFQNQNDENAVEKSYTLNVLRGEWITQLDHPEVLVQVKIYAHQYYHHLLVANVSVVRKEVVTPRDYVFTVTNNRGKDSEDIDFGTEGPCSGVNVPDLECLYVTGTIKETEKEDSFRTRVHVYYTRVPQTITLTAATQSQTWLFVTSIDIDDAKAKLAYNKLKDITVKQLEQSHVDAWQNNWDDGMVMVEGDLEIMKVLYGAQYYIKSSLPAPNTDQDRDQFYGLSPTGLGKGASEVNYLGHVFWDMETWMYPGMLMLQPQSAKDMLSYRISVIDEARARAALDNHEGARFPWESAFTGVEVTPDACVPCRELQQHITGDIAYAARQYVSATRDIDWLVNERGCEFIIDMARWWATRAEPDPDTGRYHVRNIMPPDEYHEGVDDSVYTNVGASLAIHLANYSACLCDQEIPQEWFDVATKLVLLYDEKRNYHPEYDGYNPEDETLNPGLRNKSNKIVKQADVVLLGFPFNFKYENPQTRENDLNIYRDVTNLNGPAMTWGMFCIGYKDVGDDTQQEEMFYESFKPYVREPFKVWTEVRSGIGATNFITGMGGFLQTVIFGYGGFRLYLENLAMNATLPPKTTSMTITDLNYMGARMTFKFTADSMSIEVHKISTEFPLVMELYDDNDIINLQAGQTYDRNRQPGQFYTTKESNCPLPLDTIIRDGATHLHGTSSLVLVISLLFSWISFLQW
ncbi:protein-glucosylgalactosylhydroxylysine glucosidase-like [Amphiura filiformis]|uniref:protein-glucosylgalactosylhydroxylysine glucosidase-like n=1 Tax=Amphiura filiformis TaxID=82378 RepID=UPI003B228171